MQEKNGLSRVLGPLDATCVVVGAIVGVGIFFTPSRVATLTQTPGLAMFTWTLGGVIAMLGALTFAKLGKMYPHTGGQYEILRDAYGPFPSFLFVFCNATAIQAGAIAVIAIVCAQNLSLAVTGQNAGPATAQVLAVSLTIAIAAANAVGVRWGAAIQNLTVFAKLATLLAIGAMAAWMHDPAQAIPDAVVPAVAATLPPGDSGTSLGRVAGMVFAGLVPVLFSYGGWQHALWMAGEVRNPRRNVPLSVIGGTLIVIIVYLLSNWAYFKLLGADQVARSETLAADAVAAVFATHGRRATAIAVAISAFGVLNAQLLSGPRLIYRMARDGRFFAPFAGVSKRFATPLPAIVMMAVVALLLLAVAGQDGVDQVLTGAVLLDGIFFVLTGLSLLILQRKQRRDNGESRALTTVIVVLFVLGESAVVVGAYCDSSVRQAAYLGVGWVMMAGLFYVLFFRRVETDRGSTRRSES
ncbi:MAG: APC family permease [Planctomycetota bacterium]